jgi:tetratricopeptide (TPR) repeat protein
MNRLKIIVLLVFLTLDTFAKEFPVCKEYFYIRESETEQKQSFLEKILKENPSSVECMLKLSSVYLRTDRVSEGFDLIRRAYALDSDFVESQNISKVLDLALRVSRLKEVAAKNSDVTLWNELGDVYFEIGIFNEASIAYEESLKVDADQTKIGVLLALCDGNLGKPKSSKNRLENIVQKQPYSFYANYYLGKVLKNSLSREDDARKYLMMADYIITYKNPEFKDKNEFIFLKNDLKSELEEK